MKNDNIIIRKADKSSSYVILNKKEYFDKINCILNDETKFKAIKKDPTDKVKTQANKLISSLNASENNLNISKIIGDFQPGYLYGNIKTHKLGNPIRPIISQVTTPTYQLSKALNSILTPYIPAQYMLKSTDDFIDLLRSQNCKRIIASLDVESLFTNVPIDSTIDIIIKHAYNHPSIPSPQISQNLLKQLLYLCTKELPFRSPDEKLYIQINGVAMGSPLGPLFANFYMADLENNVFSNIINRPHIYARYVDDVFINTDDERKLDEIKSTFTSNSALNFTTENSTNNRLAFLDTLIDNSQNTFSTTVYHKPTDIGQCLNANSDCSDKYKNSVVKNYLNRAYKISQNWSDFHNEVLLIKQTLINNNYSNTLVDKITFDFINSKIETTPKPPTNTISVFYNSQYHKNYKIEERILREIISRNTECIQQNTKLNIVFYYKNPKASSLVMRNNLSPPTPTIKKTNVIYCFKCPLPHGDAVEYVGLTSTTIDRRLTSHLQRGSILEHFKDCHSTKPTKQQLADNTTILDHAPDRYRLFIKEALHIIKQNPSINRQYDNFTNVLKLYTHRNYTDRRPPLVHPTSPTRPHVTSPPLSITPSAQNSMINDNSPIFRPPLAHPTSVVRSQFALSPIQNSLIADSSPIFRHNVSPQIFERINNLIQNERTAVENPPPYSPIAHRLRSQNLHSPLNNYYQIP